MMVAVQLFFATNRGHEGKSRVNPKRYGPKPSNDGGENLRFGAVTLKGLLESKIKSYLDEDMNYGRGNGGGLSQYIHSVIKEKSMKIDAYPDNYVTTKPDVEQLNKNPGSIVTFEALREKMKKSADVLIYIHGFNVSWEEAVASALALQLSLNQSPNTSVEKEIVVVLFTWPSDGQAIPIYSYKSDRSDAEFSGSAFGRGLLKFRDFLVRLNTRERVFENADDKFGKPKGQLLCEQDVHILCHSMGNYVLQNTLKRLIEFNHGMRLPRLFDHIFMCAPDVDDNVMEEGQPLHRLSELSRQVSIYHNTGDVAMYISDYTKQNPDRLGLNGVAKVATLSQKVHQINCSEIVTGAVEHSYYLDGVVNEDIRMSIASIKQDAETRRRHINKNAWPNIWTLHL